MFIIHINMNNNNNLYDILGIIKTATQEEIKKAYRKLSLELHPDRNNNSKQSNADFIKLSNAYETLGNEEKRKIYDMKNNSNSENTINPNEILNFFTQNIFSKLSNFNVDESIEGIKQKLNKPIPIIKSLEITLTKAYNGCTIPLEISRWVNENGIKREELETIYINIPKGVDNNELIVLRDKGHVINDSIKGDIKIFIITINDTEFIRTGLDLVLNKTIGLKEALCGFSFDMKHLNGKTFKINSGNGNVIDFNYKKILPDMGMQRDNYTGSIIIHFTIIFPETLTSEQVNAISSIL